MTPDALFSQIQHVPFSGRRRLVALCGGPASGKSTLAEALAGMQDTCAVVPMDGFHLDNRVLEQRGLRARKGAPQTFDAAGFVHLIRRLRTEDEIVIPVFDRSRDLVLGGAAVVGPEVETVVVEGNYLLLDAPHWRDLSDLWDFSIQLSVPQDVLRDRLVQRWVSYGFSEAEALARAQSNDLPNAAFVAAHALPADLVVTHTA
ncbi:nucleoside triphosphate hydrolase [Marivita sp. S0852]|uniref:nucleoside triphosphate hydrolase n=1 Tax=Marivita sp. S0852 TaxID=3373893 RepID=UPI00398269FC